MTRARWTLALTLAALLALPVAPAAGDERGVEVYVRNVGPTAEKVTVEIAREGTIERSETIDAPPASVTKVRAAVPPGIQPTSE